MPTASRASMASREIGVVREKPILGVPFWGVLSLVLLVLCGGGHHPLALGVAVLAPGLLLCFRPPETGFGPGMRYAFLAFGACLLLAFIPQFYWPTAGWRIRATETYGIDLPWILSVQPRMSFEGCVLITAGFAWFSVLANSQFNRSGLKWTLFAFSVAVLGLAGFSAYGAVNHMQYVMAEDSPVFSFFPHRNQMASFMAMSGVISFGFGLEGLRNNRALHMVGLIASGLCLFTLLSVFSRAGVFLYFLGVSLVLFVQFWKVKSGFYLKLGIPLVLLTFVAAMLGGELSVERLIRVVSTPSELFSHYRVEVFKDAWVMFLDAPISGFGLGNFAAIFPQYRDASVSPQTVSHPGSDLLWLMIEGGLLSLLCLGALLFFYTRLCCSKRADRVFSYRPILMVALLIFGLHSFVEVSAHRLGTAYLALFVAALMVPYGRQQPSWIRPFWWRALGLGLSFVGVLWIASYALGWRLHSTPLAEEQSNQIDGYIKGQDYLRAHKLVDAQLKRRPLDWQLYYQRGQLELADLEDRNAAEESFRAARFVEPNLAKVCYEEGFAWVPYDLSRAVEAWGESLIRESDDRMASFDRMVHASLKNPLLLDRLSILSELGPDYRVHFLTRLESVQFERELLRELEANPDLLKYTNLQRSELLKHWINHSDLATAESFLLKHEEALDQPWKLWAELRKSQAQFKEAVEIVRESLAVPMIPEVDLDLSQLAVIERGFAVVSSDFSKGAWLLQHYLRVGDLGKALVVADAMAGLENAPIYALYWKAEVLYLMEDYIESWYVFDRYMNR